MIKLLYIPVIFLAFSACSNSVAVTEPAPGITILKPNSKFNIPLPENHTTGYMWQLGNSYDETTIDYMNSVWHGNEKGVIFNFETKAKGKTNLEFVLIKYLDTLEVKQFIIEVK